MSLCAHTSPSPAVHPIAIKVGVPVSTAAIKAALSSPETGPFVTSVWPSPQPGLTPKQFMENTILSF